MVYLLSIQNIYKKAKLTINVFDESVEILLQREVIQGDVISSKLFIAALEQIFHNINRSTKGMKIDGEYLSHLRFADGLVLFSNNADELQNMVNELDKSSRNIVLTLNRAKTKAMINTHEILNISL